MSQVFTYLLRCRLSKAQGRKLERLARITHRSRSSVIRALVEAAQEPKEPDIRLK